VPEIGATMLIRTDSHAAVQGGDADQSRDAASNGVGGGGSIQKWPPCVTASGSSSTSPTVLGKQVKTVPSDRWRLFSPP